MGKNRERALKAERFMGDFAWKLGLLGSDQRGGVTKAAIIKTIAVEGPSWGYRIKQKSVELATNNGLAAPSDTSVFYRHIDDLVSRGYLKEKQISDNAQAPGLERHFYDLTVKGSIVAMQMQYVRDHISDFVKHVSPEDKAHHVFRLPALEAFRVWQERGVAQKLTDFVLKRAARNIFAIGGFDLVDEEQLRGDWTLQVFASLMALQRLDATELKKMGLTREESQKASRVLREDPAAREYMAVARTVAEQALEHKVGMITDLKNTLKAVLGD